MYPKLYVLNGDNANDSINKILGALHMHEI